MTLQEQKPLVIQWRLNAVKPKPRKVRARSWAPKVRTGCRTCKVRKLKCGEEKPSCHRCVTGNFECDYAPGKGRRLEGSSPSRYKSTTTPAPSTSPSLWGHGLDINEQRALVYFKERTVPILASFTYASTSFWTRIIPSMSLNNPIVRSAMIAASSLHETVHYRNNLLQPTMFPERLHVKHLSRSISALTIQDQPPSREVVLMTCLLFLLCENLKQAEGAARMHVNAGLKLLREWKSEGQRSLSPNCYTADSLQDVIVNTLEPIFARLEAQVSLTKDSSLGRADFVQYDLNWNSPIIPNSFSDLFSARDAQHDAVSYCFYQTRLNSGPLLLSSPAYRKIASLFSQWDRTFLSSFPQYADRTWSGWSTGAALRFHQLALSLTLHSEAHDDITYWDSHLPEVKWLVETSYDIVISGPPPTSQRDSLWLYNFCLTPPLFLTALHCRDPLLRRKAIALMRVQHSWNNAEPPQSCTIAQFCEMITSIEEGSLTAPNIAADIPASGRIRLLTVSLSTPKQLIITYTHPDSTSPDVIHTKTSPWKYWTPPTLDTLITYPFGEIVKYGQFQGLIRPARMGCVCKTYGVGGRGEWEVPT